MELDNNNKKSDTVAKYVCVFLSPKVCFFKYKHSNPAPSMTSTSRLKSVLISGVTSLQRTSNIPLRYRLNKYAGLEGVYPIDRQTHLLVVGVSIFFYRLNVTFNTHYDKEQFQMQTVPNANSWNNRARADQSAQKPTDSLAFVTFLQGSGWLFAIGTQSVGWARLGWHSV